jgi:hypothetical protein
MPGYDQMGSSRNFLLDGSPSQPYRTTIARENINGSVTLLTTVLYVFAIVAEAGDVFNHMSFIVKTQATSTVSHAWTAIYNGVGTGAALLASTSDVTAGWAAGKQDLALSATIANVPTVGTPQGGGTAAIVPSGPAVWGFAMYNVTSGTGSIIDGNAGGSLAGEIAVTGQVPLVSTATVSSTATAPAVLPTMAAASFGNVYGVLCTK